MARLGVWRSLVARSVRVGEVPSSNLGTPISLAGRRAALFARSAAWSGYRLYRCTGRLWSSASSELCCSRQAAAVAAGGGAPPPPWGVCSPLSRTTPSARGGGGGGGEPAP